MSIKRAFNFSRLKLKESYSSLIWQLNLNNIRENNIQKLIATKENKKNCFLLGNGKSLQLIAKEDLDNSYIIGTNSFHHFMEERQIIPDLYLMEDDQALENNLKSLLKYQNQMKLCLPITLGGGVNYNNKNLILLNLLKALNLQKFSLFLFFKLLIFFPFSKPFDFIHSFIHLISFIHSFIIHPWPDLKGQTSGLRGQISGLRCQFLVSEA